MNEYDVYYTDRLRVAAHDIGDAEKIAIQIIKAERMPGPGREYAKAFADLHVTTVRLVEKPEDKA